MGRVRDQGEMLLTAEEVNHCQDTVEMSFKGSGFQSWFSSAFFGSVNPFMVFSRCNEDNRLVYKHFMFF